VRAAFLILAVFIALAERLGLEVLFGAFTAGAILKVADHDRMMTHPNFHLKLEAIGFGVFIPIFFVTSGLRFNLQALLASVSGLALVPVFLAGLLIVRGLPAVLYRPLIGARQALIAGLLQSTSLPFIVVASMVGVELGMLSAATGTALVAAGLLSVLIFPLAALSLLRREGTMPAPKLTVPSGTAG
jgi:Kef-type K+ transport system membrane component KefB